MVRKILVATTNRGKISELKAMLGGSFELVGLSDFDNIAEVEEDGETFTENARKKAIGYAKATDCWTIADDSGLVVDALGGEPGVRSARFSGAKANNRGLLDRRNMAKVLLMLESVAAEKRTARFVCHLCLAKPGEVLIKAEGTLEGLIAEEQAGENGFGYDPIFFVPGLGKTVAQLTAEQKNAISHRGNAIRRLKPLLESLLAMGEK